MNPIAVILPLADGDSSCVDPRFARDYEACMSNDAFEVALCNIEDCLAGDELDIDQVSPRKATYSLLRTAPTWRMNYSRIEHELKRKGYKLIATDGGRFHFRWNDWDYLMRMFSSGIPTHRKKAPYDTQKADWRAYYFDGVFFYGARLKRGRKEDKPPEHLLSLAEGRYDTKPFCYIDFYKHEKGFWLPLTMGDAQFSILPKSASAEEFYGKLADVMAETPHLPEWTWCLVGNVVDRNKIGVGGNVVRGTRNFAPGTKVYLICELGGNGWERPNVLGVPRYCDHLVSLLMPVSKIRELRCEKVYNRDVIAVMENAHFGDFFCPVKSEHDGVWDKTSRSLNRIRAL